jgi:hypothetical protein
MSYNKIDKMVLFTINNKKFLEKNKEYKKKINIVEGLSVFFLPLLLLFIYFINLHPAIFIVSSIISLVLYVVSGISHDNNDNYATPSWVPNFFSPLNFLFKKILKKNIYSTLGINVNDATEYNKIVKSNKSVYFYTLKKDIISLIENNDIDKALYYWKEIDLKSTLIREKIYARNNIKQINEIINTENLIIENYNKENNEIEEILRLHNIENDKKEVKVFKKIKIVNI